MGKSLLKEDDLRRAVKQEITDKIFSKDRVVDEFVIGGRGRIDLAVIGREISGYEFKSDADSLSRLPRQMDVFGEVCQYCTLVVTNRHLKKAREILKNGWGLALVDGDKVSGLTYRQLRKPKQIRTLQKNSLLELLWREEIMLALDKLNALDGYRSKPKSDLIQRLASMYDINSLQTIVTSTITERQGWRDETEPHEYVEKRQSSHESSRFLARRIR